MTQLADPPVIVPAPAMPATPAAEAFARPTEAVYRLSVAQYHAMLAAGILTSDDPVELIEGVLVLKMPKNPPHETVIGNIQDLMPRSLPAGWLLRLQAPVTLADGEPEPDVAIVRGRRTDYAARHPGPADIAAVMEVADTTLPRDRGVKLRSYARAGIAQYFIANLETRTIECYTRPDPATGTYAERVDLAAGATLTVALPDGAASLTLPVNDLW